ncbi:hypothetical protein [Ammoniphilus sp. YIM 78166]|uniref:hypothetical protein n=1 Tax=Ammoniphilus sp. YIM 78166 TaxID=1644106 RepID=UPI00142F5B96|nr:hypothetical protein [Ammoniphilus sp. YIM 78166]
MPKHQTDKSHSYVSVKIGERKVLLNKSALVRRKRMSLSGANSAYDRRRIDRLIRNLRVLDSNLNQVLRHVDYESRSRLLKMMRSIREEHLNNWGSARGNSSKNKEVKKDKPAKKRKAKETVKAKQKKSKQLASKDKTSLSGTKQAAETKDSKIEKKSNKKDQSKRLKKKGKANKSASKKRKKRPSVSSPQQKNRTKTKNSNSRRQPRVNAEFFESTTRDFPEQRVDDLLQSDQNQDSLFQDPRYIDTITIK